MAKINKCDEFLKYLSKIYLQNPSLDINSDTIYSELSKIGIPSTIKVDSLFNRWIFNFKNNPNIKVFVQDNWKYFCQFKNNEFNDKKALNNPIKMYIPLKPVHINECVQLIFDYISKNRIYHNSKVATNIRNDNVVIRVYNKEDSIKINNFINSNKFIVENMNEPNPFVFSKGKIGYAADGSLSFNDVLSKYISNYLKICKEKNKLDEVSISDFFEYVKQIYERVFILKNNVDTYLSIFNKSSNNKAEIINNYKEITKLLLDSIRYGEMKNYFSDIDEFNTKKDVEITVTKELNIDLFNEMILTLIKKYGLQIGKNHIEDYIIRQNLLAVTRDNDLRNRVKQELTPGDCIKILKNKSLDEYIGELTKIKTSDIRCFALDNAVKETILKYGKEQAYCAILEALKGNFTGFTNTNNVRSNLISTTSKEDLIKQFTIKGKIDYNKIDRYIENISNELEMRKQK